MKILAAILVAVLLAVGAGAAYWFTRPSTLTIVFRLAEGAEPRTELLEWSVERVGDTAEGELVSLTTVAAMDRTGPATFEVEPGAPLRVLGRLDGVVAVTREASVPRGGAVTLDIVEEAALVTVDAELNPGVGPALRVSNADRAFALTPASEDFRALLPPGDWTLAMGNDVTVLHEVSLTAGEEVQLTFDTRVREVEVALDVPAEWAADLPAVRYEIDAPDGSTTRGTPISGEPGAGARARLVFGERTAKLEFEGDLRTANAEQTVTVDETTQRIVFAPKLSRVVVDASALGTVEEPVWVELREVEFKGEAAGTSERTDDLSEPIALFHDDDHPYGTNARLGIVVQDRGGVIAMRDIGELSAGDDVEVSIEAGEGGALCEALYDPGTAERMCARLRAAAAE